MQSTVIETHNPGESALRCRFYRANYAVILRSVFDQLPTEAQAKFDALMAEYAIKFPISSKHRYATVETEEDNWGEEENRIESTLSGDNIAFPCALLYSMPQDWQLRFDEFCDSCNRIEMDCKSYEVELLRPGATDLTDTICDRYNYRNRKWATDSEGDSYGNV
jgi:hypothetical protein